MTNLWLPTSGPIVIKNGTDAITNANGWLNGESLKNLCDQVVELKKGQFEEILLVSSGAMAAGRELCGVQKTDTETSDDKKGFATCGQPRLMAHFHKYLFENHNYIPHQILLSKTDFRSEDHRTELARTIQKIRTDTHEGVAVINANDALSRKDVYGDNDVLAAEIGILVRAKLVVLLTNVNGLFENLDDKESLIQIIRPEEHKKYGKCIRKDTTSKNGSGGMASKFKQACRLASEGIHVLMLNGKRRDILTDTLIKGQLNGTLFLPKESKA